MARLVGWFAVLIAVFLVGILHEENRYLKAEKDVFCAPPVRLDSPPKRFSSRPVFGTIMTRSIAADIFENVCIGQLEKKRRGESPLVIYSYSPESISSIASIDSSRWIEKWAHKTVGKPIDQWKNDSSHGIIEEETLLMLDIVSGNPAHCLTDQAFSMAVDIQSRQLVRTANASSFYPRFLRPGWKGSLMNDCPMDEWCCEFMNMIGFVDNKRIVAPPEDEDELLCFRKLVVPHHSAFRFPTDEMHLSDTLKDLQNRALSATGLQGDPWLKSEIPDEVEILLYNRKDTRRRILENSEVVKELLEKEYHTKVTLIGENWKDFTHNVMSQATVYNKSPFIIAPHGAHLANLVFTRQGTRVVEIACFQQGSAEYLPNEINLTITKKEETSKFEDWYGQPPRAGPGRWFYSFSRKLNVEHFSYSEHEGCLHVSKRDNNTYISFTPDSFTVNAPRFVAFAASRFGLKKRATARTKARTTNK